MPRRGRARGDGVRRGCRSTSHASVSSPNSVAFAAATATTRSLNECVGFAMVELQAAPRRRRARCASRGARHERRQARARSRRPRGGVGRQQRRVAPERARAGLDPLARRRRARPRPSRRPARAARSSARRCRSRAAGYSLSQTRQRRTSTGMATSLRSSATMEFRRIHDLPPYVFATVDQLKRELRRDGRDVIDLGFGNPDIPSPRDRGREARARPRAKPANHRYSASRGLPQPARGGLRALRARASASSSTPSTQVVSTIGAKEGLAHLMWVLRRAAATSPSCRRPSYPIHLVAPRLAGATVVHARSTAATCSPRSRRRCARRSPRRAS